MKPMTDEEYVAKGGVVCPFCGDENNVEGATFEVYPGGVSQQCWCNSCDKEWWDHYELVGYEEIVR